MDNVQCTLGLNFMKYPLINPHSNTNMICYEMLLVPKVFDVQIKKMQMQFKYEKNVNHNLNHIVSLSAVLEFPSAQY